MDLGTILSAVVLGVSALLTVLFVDSEKHLWIKAALAAGLAAFGPILASAIDSLSAGWVKPQVRFVPTFVPNRLQLRVEADKPTLDTVALELHAPVWVEHVSRSHSVGAAKDLVFVEGEPSLPYLTNRVEIRADDVQGQRSLGYEIHYVDPPVPGIQFGDRDLVRLSYTWMHKGERHQADRWFALPDGRIVQEPWARMGPIRMVGEQEAGELEMTVTPLRDGPPPSDWLMVFVPSDDVRVPLVGETPFGVTKRRSITP